jgi:phage-related protein
MLMWHVLVLNETVEVEIRGLPADMRARLAQFMGTIAASGLQFLPRDSIKHLEGKLWELRIRGKDGISRAIYVTASGQRVVIIRVFVKKTQKTPPAELKLARQRAKEVE